MAWGVGNFVLGFLKGMRRRSKELSSQYRIGYNNLDTSFAVRTLSQRPRCDASAVGIFSIIPWVDILRYVSWSITGKGAHGPWGVKEQVTKQGSIRQAKLEPEDAK